MTGPSTHHIRSPFLKRHRQTKIWNALPQKRVLPTEKRETPEAPEAKGRTAKDAVSRSHFPGPVLSPKRGTQEENTMREA